MSPRFLAFALVAAAVSAAAPAAAHGINTQGVAVRGPDVYRAWVSGDVFPGAPPGGRIFHVLLLPPDSAEPAADATFIGVSNFFDAHDDPLFVNPAFFAASTTTGVDFRLDGVQQGTRVTATGHHQDLQLALTVNLLPP